MSLQVSKDIAEKEMDWKTVIQEHLVELVKHTEINTEMIAHLFQADLVTRCEKDELNNLSTSNSKRAVNLYSNISRKWEDEQFSKLKSVLIACGNIKSLKILNNDTAKVFDTSEYSPTFAPTRMRTTTATDEANLGQDEVTKASLKEQTTPSVLKYMLADTYSSEQEKACQGEASSSSLPNTSAVPKGLTENPEKQYTLMSLVHQYITEGRYDVAAPLCEKAIEDISSVK